MQLYENKNLFSLKSVNGDVVDEIAGQTERHIVFAFSIYGYKFGGGEGKKT